MVFKFSRTHCDTSSFLYVTDSYLWRWITWQKWCGNVVALILMSMEVCGMFIKWSIWLRNLSVCTFMSARWITHFGVICVVIWYTCWCTVASIISLLHFTFLELSPDFKIRRLPQHSVYATCSQYKHSVGSSSPTTIACILSANSASWTFYQPGWLSLFASELLPPISGLPASVLK